jgi:hypothetical protein
VLNTGHLNKEIQMRRTYIAVLVLSGAALTACASAVTQTTVPGPSPTTVVTAVVPEATTVANTVPTTEVEADYSTAQATLHAWAAAIGANDVDAALATHESDPDDLVSEREAMGYLAAVVHEAEFSDCRFSTALSDEIRAECDLTLMDPILVVTGQETVPVIWRLSSDGKEIIVSEPGNRLTSENLFVAIAQEQYPDEFAEVCGPGTVNYNGLVGWAFNRACGEFTAAVAGEVVDAINETSYSVAQETLNVWAAAIAADDVDAALATHTVDPDDLASDREAIGYLAVTISDAEFNDCEFSTKTDGLVVAECDLTLNDPTLVATGMDTVRVSWQLSDDGTAILESEPGFRLSTKDRFVPYAVERYPEEFAGVCGPGTVNYNSFTGWAFNRACGEFAASIADEVVEAINAIG